GKAKKFFGNSNSVLDAVIGGWSLTGVARFNSGLPVSPGETGLWSTNWNLTSPSTPLTSLKTGSNKNISGGGTATLNGRPNLFANPDAAYKSIRNSRPGEEVGRNALRLPGYAVLDAGLYKSFRVPHTEMHHVTFRWEVFNVLNHQPLGGLST